MSGESKKTTDHETIRKWAEQRKGIPTTVAQTEGQGGEPGVLRFRFLGYSDEDKSELDDISWEQFFEKFEEKKLAMLYQEETREGEESRFFKFVKR